MTEPTPDAERTVRSDGFDLAVYEYGDAAAPTVVLVHGWPDDHHLWDRVIPLLAGRFHVVAYDTRGHGRSTRTTRTADYRLDRFAADFFAVAAAVSPDRPVHVLAHDWGSVEMWEAVCEPGAQDRIASFTSVSGPNLDHLGTWMRAKLSRGAAWGPFTQLLSSTYTFLFMTPGLPRVLLRPLSAERVWRRFVGLMNETDAANVTLGPAFREDFFDGMRIYRANILPRLLGPRERRTEVPVQLIIARRDVAVRPAGYADTQRWAPRLWRREVAGGHWLPFSHPELLATATAELVDALDGGPAPRGLRRAEAGRARGRFDDQLVVITGGGSGIGRETALAFARHGAEIVLSDINLDAAKETAELVSAAGGVAHAYSVDVGDEAAMAEHAAAVVAAHGVPDILVNNAGIGQAGDFFETSARDFDRVLRVNLGGVINGCRTFGAAMAERGLGGHIVNLSSMAAYTPQRGFSAYSTSKSAVFMFSDCLRAELAGKGIGVHTVCPGIVHTNIVATTRFSGVSAEEEARKQARYDDLYRKRHYGPDKVAAQIVRAVQNDRAIVPVTPEAHLQYHFHRFAPALARFVAARVKLT
ncbi:SDR family oxidoreductase [Nocardia terpenica]|uniref:SDR family oxidoreductase n=1 Tax=Nocardia terpenica TaxID=455432 RepID=UPI0018943820|nr:SDR family oxidoreductase [Nocardia terpenica]MBF6065410.1 SDR family oxidoreductase [Nocardia terpenica]MBF6109092.1 SDR family oxidoreductase [Nocardia terpenica]MBF6114706.1 SDR family oxidoreductase [Nocardia terpenica]MBF6123391.1 SDR family oxidoreductase [Nocardia terpenica]MBF6156591.1 SDR family oxidoreductase [Nocardia terpenica]